MFGSNLQSGKLGEAAAVSFLRKKGYQIIAQNFRIRNGEIDIIAVDRKGKEEVLVFIEVKARSSEQFGKPIESITPWKLAALYRALMFYKQTHPKTPDILRVDAVCVLLGGNGNILSIEQVENITG